MVDHVDLLTLWQGGCWLFGYRLSVEDVKAVGVEPGEDFVGLGRIGFRVEFEVDEDVVGAVKESVHFSDAAVDGVGNLLHGEFLFHAPGQTALQDRGDGTHRFLLGLGLFVLVLAVTEFVGGVLDFEVGCGFEVLHNLEVLLRGCDTLVLGLNLSLPTSNLVVDEFEGGPVLHHVAGREGRVGELLLDTAPLRYVLLELTLVLLNFAFHVHKEAFELRYVLTHDVKFLGHFVDAVLEDVDGVDVDDEAVEFSHDLKPGELDDSPNVLAGDKVKQECDTNQLKDEDEDVRSSSDQDGKDFPQAIQDCADSGDTCHLCEQSARSLPQALHGLLLAVSGSQFVHGC